MTTDIVIRTYVNDLKWLEHSLRSIAKYVSGHRQIIVCIPVGQGHLLSHLTAEKVIEVPDLSDGYLGQQLTKMQAYLYTDADAVIFWDSDVIAAQPIDVKAEYFHGDRPIMYKTRYTSMQGNPWQPITTKAVGFTPEWEYMRRMPIVHRRDTLLMCDAFMRNLHGMPLAQYIAAQPLRSFSEFNVLGAFAEAHVPDRYHILDTEAIDMPPNKIEQFWSWGGLTNDIQERMNNALN